MIISRWHLTMERVVDDNGVLQYEADGSALASNKKVFMVLGPVEKEVREKLVKILPDSDPGAKRISITPETAREILKNVPRDKRYGGLLEHVDMRADGSTGVNVEMTDGKRTRKFQFKRRSKSSDAGAVLNHIYRVMGNPDNTHMALNRKRLLMLLEAMEKASEDASGEAPVWISISREGDIAIRGWDFKFGRPVLGYMSGYKGDGVEAPPYIDWEETFCEKGGILPRGGDRSQNLLPRPRKLLRRVR